MMEKKIEIVLFHFRGRDLDDQDMDAAGGGSGFKV